MRGSSASARVLMVEAHKGQLYLLPERRPAKFQRIDNDGLTRRITGPGKGGRGGWEGGGGGGGEREEGEGGEGGGGGKRGGEGG